MKMVSLYSSNILLCNSTTSINRLLGNNAVLLSRNLPNFLTTLLPVGNLFYPEVSDLLTL